MSADATAAPPPTLPGSGLSPVLTVSRRDGVLREIRRAIVLGSLKPGEKLTENRLSASLNVSRPTMREALAQLAQEGLLIQEPYRGLRVAALEPEQILDLARTRMSLDTLAVEGILADRSGRRLELIKAAWRDFDRLPTDADPVERHEAHIAFHRRIWEASENSFLIRLWPVTEAHLTIALAQDRVVHDDERLQRDAHQRIVHAIIEAAADGDRSRVQRALAEHTLTMAAELAEITRRG